MESLPRPLVVGLGGTNRENSSTERILRVALDAAEKAGAQVDIICGTGLELPIYSQGVQERTPAARALVDKLRRCDGLVLASPGYHGSLSGLVKNALDFVEDMSKDDRPYLSDRAVGCIACAYGWQATVTTMVALRSIVHALRAWPTPLGAAVNTAMPTDGDAGEAMLRQVRMVGEQVLEFAQMRQAFQAQRKKTAAA